MTCKCHEAWGQLGKEKQHTIFWNLLTTVCVVIIGIIGMIVLVEAELRPQRPRPAINKVLYPDQSEDVIPGDTRPHAFMALPAAPHCDHLHDHPGKHKLWASCMGVGYNDSRMDRYLYKNRKGEPPEAAGDVKKEKTYLAIPRWDDPTDD